MKRIFWLVLIVIFTVWVTECWARGMQLEECPARCKVSSDYVDAQLRVHRRGNVNFSVTNWGFLGSEGSNLYESPGCLFCDDPGGIPFAPSFEFPSNSGMEHLFQGALWVGGVVEGETLVSVGANGWWWIYEWAPTWGIIEKELLADQECVAIFTDTVIPPPLTQMPESTDWDQREHKPLYVEVTQKSYSWQSHPFNDFVILEYTIRNVGSKFLSDVYLGFFLDTDIYKWGETPL